MMSQLEMLTAREQLMEDIQVIIESRIDDDCDGLIETLCDAVCYHLPVSRPTSWQGGTLEVAIRQTLCL